MEQLTCRTCLKTNLLITNCLQIHHPIGLNQMTIKDMLELFIPEMDLDIFGDEVVMCLQCCESLKNAYAFKNTCLKTEEKLYDYLQHHDIKLGHKITLGTFLEHKITESNLTVINNNDAGTLSPEKPKKESDSEKGTRKCNYNSLKRKYTCDLCEYKAYRLDLLNTHKQKHDKNVLHVKEYSCDFCTYTTLRKRALDRHLFTHKGKSPHLCNVCNKPFAEKYQLKLHQITHTEQELPHKCDKCGKGYLTKSYLKQHMETKHVTVKKKTCKECDEEQCPHLVTRHYKCNMCEASFSDKRGLDAHQFMHKGGELPYKCLHCNFSTAWKGNLTKHLRKRH